MNTLHHILPLVRRSVGLGALLLLLQACNSSDAAGTMASDTAPPTDAIPVKVMDLAPTERAVTVHAAGLFSTDDETVLSFKAGGIVSAVLVKEGDHVNAGQLLATLDLTEINAQVQQAELGLEKSTRDLERAEHLHRDSVASLEQLQNARTGRDVAQQQYNAAAFNQRYAQIRAAADGFVLKKFVNAGQLVGPGTPVVQVNGAGKATWVLKAGVSDKDWALLAPGDSATITADALPGKVLHGVVSSRSMGADPMSGAFQVEVRVTGEEAKQLASGLYGKVSIATRQHVKGWAVPYEALLDGDRDTGFAFVVKDGKAVKVPVRIAAIHGDKAILDRGLEGQAQLIVSGSAYLTNGSAVTIIR